MKAVLKGVNLIEPVIFLWSNSYFLEGSGKIFLIFLNTLMISIFLSQLTLHIVY
jgi:hypothetical protein